MQIASSGLRWATARAANAMGHKPPMISTRSIHIPHAPSPPLRTPPTTVQRVAQTARTAAVRFFQHLTTPGIGAQGCAHHVGPRAFQAAVRPTIQQGFSLPVRNALLNKPFSVPCLPRAPVVPRGMYQVGLGTARAFHSGRPIFANLVDNVPVAVRALAEADVDLKKRKVSNKPSLLKKKASAKSQEKGKGPRAKENAPAVAKTAVVEDSVAEDLDVYLPVAAVAPVTTRVVIPLAPTPSGRTPLPADIPASSSSSTGRFLPLSALAKVHASHHTHSLRVSTVFARLDSAGVWKDPGVRSRSYGSPDGTCVLLEVTFDGWDEERVRAVLGDAGQGWCEIEETRTGIEDSVLDQPAPRSETAPESTTSEEIDHWFSGLDHHLSSPQPARVEIEFDPAESVVLPTLDFSSFAINLERHSESDEDWDAFSDGILSDLGSDDVALHGLSSTMRDLSHGWDAASPPTHEGPIKYLF